MNKLKILLLHPPALPNPHLKTNCYYQLDGLCSQPQKGPFRWHPIDLLAFASKYSHQNDINVEIMDLGSKIQFDFDNVFLNRFLNYDIIIGLIGVCNWNNYKKYWNEVLIFLKAKKNIKIFLTGDIARHFPYFLFQELPLLDGIIPELALPPTIEDFFNKENKNDQLWINSKDKKEYLLPFKETFFNLNIQPFELWNNDLYRLPFSFQKPFASVLTQVGCPHCCSYCILSSYKPMIRDYEELKEELIYLKKKAVRHLYIRDATINSSKKHFEKILEIITPLKFTWNGFFRIEGIAQYASDIYKSGGKFIQLGIDSLSPETLVEHKKIGKLQLCNQRLEDYQQTIISLKKNKIRVVGHFVSGLNKNYPLSLELKAIVDWSKKTNLDLITISPLMKRPGTIYWNMLEFINNTNYINVNSMAEEQIKKAILNFYLSPKNISKTIYTIIKQPLIIKYALNNFLKFNLFNLTFNNFMDFRPYLRKIELAFFRSKLSYFFAVLMKNYAQHLYRRVIADIGPLKEGAVLLDVGCGHGTFLRLYGKKYPKVKLVGIDQSPELIKYAKKRCEEDGVDVQFIVKDIHQMTFSPKSFDLITSGSSIYLWHDPSTVLNNLYNALKSGGKMIIYDELPASNSATSIFQALFKQKLYGLGLPAYTKEELLSFTNQKNFDKVDVSIDNLIIKIEINNHECSVT
ncbi:MAG: methyltransferase domain-containing protein [Oligoflexia bacterium]|nr:methyltransferase domain-containing protein [Oligoflexia bacterium]